MKSEDKSQLNIKIDPELLLRLKSKAIKSGKTLTAFITELLEIIDQENIKAIVVGNPLNMDGSKGPSSQSALDKAKMIENRTNTPVALWDERLSTVGAFKISSQLDINVSKRVQKIDENAATFILQGAIEFLNN